MKPIAVIILNWNGEKLLREFLPSVVANTPEDIADVIVADNGSTDGSIPLLEKEFPQVKILRFEENLGFAGGYNRAIAETGYRFTLLLNSDVETPVGYLEPLYEFMSNHPEVGAVQPKILSYTEKTKFEYAGASGGFIDRNGYPYCRGRIFDSVEEDHGQYDSPTEVFWATGAALFVRTDIYEKAGGLDERFFAHMEEIDLCWRMKTMGYQLWCIPQSVVYHLGGGSLPAENPKKTYLNFRNNLLLLHKNLPEKVKRTALRRRRLLDTLAFCKFLATFDFPNARAILRAHRDFRRMRPLYPPLRSAAPSIGEPPLRGETEASENRFSLRKYPNILVEYFLRGRRRFSQLNNG